MTEKTEILEFADKTVDRAIEAACRHFNVDRKQLNIKLITRGSTGLFGLGGRKAKITASPKAEKAVAEPPKASESPEHVADETEERHAKPSGEGGPEASDTSREAESALQKQSVPDIPAVAEPVAEAEPFVKPSGPESIDASAYAPGDEDETEEAGQEESGPPAAEYGPGEEESAEPSVEDVSETTAEEPAELSEEMLERLEKARVFATQILDKAGLDAIVEVNTDVTAPRLEISGDDISLVIGKDGHTLDAIEYIVNLNLKRSEEKGGKRISLDAQGYRAKREDGLRRTAEKLAMKARKTRRSVAMAPMNSRERRIVHMAVKGINGVRTHSTGDGRLRKVIITPLRKGDGGRRPQGRRYNRRG